MKRANKLSTKPSDTSSPVPRRQEKSRDDHTNWSAPKFDHEYERLMTSQILDAFIATTIDGLTGIALFKAFASASSEPCCHCSKAEGILNETLLQLSRTRVAYEVGPQASIAVSDTIAGLLEKLPQSLESRPIGSNWPPISPAATGVMFSLPPIGPGLPPIPPEMPPIPPQALEQIERLIALIKEMRDAGELSDDVDDLVRQLETMLERYRQGRVRAGAVLEKLGELLAEVIKRLKGLIRLGGDAGAKAAKLLEALGRMLGTLGRLLGRLFVFLGPIMWILFAADVGWAMGSAIADIPIGSSGETVGTWWGRQFWELIKGPCPDLLVALNLAINEWREAQARGANDEELANALNRVLLLEDEYIRRCLEPGSEEWRQEKLFVRNLRREYEDLLRRIRETEEAEASAAVTP